MRMFWLRLVVVLTAIIGGNYILWRWFFSLNWDAWWIAVPLVLAETYSFIDVCLFGLTMWKARTRPAPPPAETGHTVDVFIATYDEPIDLVMTTARGMTLKQPRNWTVSATSRAAPNGQVFNGTPRPATLTTRSSKRRESSFSSSTQT